MLIIFPKKRKSLYFSIILLILVPIIGTIGYIYIEDYTFIEALFMTIITISTVGFEVVKPLSQNGILFTSFLILISFGMLGYIISTITSYLFGGEFQENIKKRRMEKEFEKIENHVIVCGYGRNGKQAANELIGESRNVIVIEKRERNIDEEVIENKYLHFINGDASHEDILLKARVNKASALITTLPSDADNLFVVLTARDFNKKMTIISRASDEHSDSKLKRAGATNVIMPDKVGGSRMAKLVSNPDVVEFLENIMLKSGGTVNLEEIPCNKLPFSLRGRTIREINIKKKSGANIIGMKLENGEYVYNPPSNFVITEKTMLFVLGTPKQVNDFKNLLN